MRAAETVPKLIPRFSSRLFVVLFLLAAVGLRLCFLSSDPYPDLDWSSGLLTDESFYAHNARNLALFGTARTDEFNNMLLSPAVHLAQTAVFWVFGAGYLQARGLSVTITLLALALFFAGLNRAFGIRVATAGAVFLGLDHVALLYSRMSLLDTYALLPGAATFYCFIRGIHPGEKRRAAWLAACGFMLAVLVTNRSLCLYLVPAPAYALWRLPSRSSGLAAVYGAFAVAALLYIAVWFWPHRREIGHMTRYYRTVQLQPRSITHLGRNVYHSFLGDRRGITPYLFRHSPVILSLALLGILFAGGGRRPDAQSSEDGAAADARDSVIRFLIAWLALGGVLIAVVSYSPSRYYVTLLPALSGLAAIVLANLPIVWRRLQSPRARLYAAVITWFLVYHAVQSLVHRGETIGRLPAMLLLYGVPTLAAALVPRVISSGRPGSRRAIMTGVGVTWAVVNAAWLSHWLGTLRWSQVQTGSWLDRNLPAGSVVLGDVGAGLGLGHSFVAINVIPGLCNDTNPLEGFRPFKRYIVVLDGRSRERYWHERYPEQMAPELRVGCRRVIKWEVGIFRVDPAREVWARRSVEESGE